MQLPGLPSHYETTRSPIWRRALGTSSGQLSERKNGFLVPKRHQMKHLEFLILWFGTRGSEVQILSPRPISRMISIFYGELF